MHQKWLPVVYIALSIWGNLACGQEARLKNVVLIVADDLRADLLEIYGGPVETPNLLALANRGCRFTRATCGYPICHISRTELHTGRFLVREASSSRAVPIAGDWTLWPAVMRSNGWHTVYAGKWHMDGTPWTRGYDRTVGLFSSGGSRGRDVTFPTDASGRTVTGYRGWTFKTDTGEALPERGVGLTPDTDRLITRQAVKCIEDHGDQPLFLHVNFTAPHDPLLWPGERLADRDEPLRLPANFASSHPFDHGNAGGRDEMIVPPPRTAEAVRKQRQVYEAIVAQMDVNVGRVVAAIEDRGKLGETLFVFTSDQGLALGSHGLMGKQNQYEHTAGVPLVMAGPGVGSGRTVVAPCGLRDLYPTVCEMSGIEVPSSVEGISLVGLLADGPGMLDRPVYGYFTDTQRMIRLPDGWKLIWYPKANRVQLFDLNTDPAEMLDLADSPPHAGRRDDLFQQLQSWLQERGDPVLDKAVAAQD